MFSGKKNIKETTQWNTETKAKKRLVSIPFIIGRDLLRSLPIQKFFRG